MSNVYAPWGRDLLSIDQLSREHIDNVMRYAEKLEPYSGRGNKLEICRGEILRNAFFEPSTRTCESFATAMLTLGGDVRDFRPEGSSMEKHEDKYDTLRTLEQYSDIIVIRDPGVGSVRSHANLLKVPVINAGDGTGEHPSQALLDCYTIKRVYDSLDGLHIVFMGDLKFGRTVHSLIKALRKYNKNRFFGYSPAGLELPEELSGPDYFKLKDMNVARFNPDVVYATRIQKERMRPKDRGKFHYYIDRDFVKSLPGDAILMHPFPRVDEMARDIDEDDRVMPFEQIRNGVQTRMALLALMLGHEKEIASLPWR